ncbi:alpha-amylase family glycosyl hydrolase [Spirilliplanes yamanashiensis]|uniref:Sucrose phosphorylase n=1 Tax=Spirilliplanes yamanashiensis TaxID=42233 RepID=A0A8J3YFI2_9ACTN|nr:alpha-amylase family glycosyl hydrolase [Spirilliplanes yamanashiensis]MDP9818235.1 sucrose phosphorylase [Spirilliplanes yamanashiensis]GIJ06737.1 sucrose phosphorylase [Spirilliplanes yamanashiensis]
MRNQVQLIAYADRLGGSLPALTRLLEGPLAGLFGGVHVLPFYLPYDGADAGFDPVDHRTVDPRLGDWADVRRLGRSLDVVADLVVNHVSDRSAEFRDVVERGGRSPYAGMFLTYGRVFPAGATEDDLARVVRPRPGLPFTPVLLGGRRRLVWTTFTSHQVDLDVRHPAARRYLSEVLRRLAGNGVTTVRLDAVGYAVKTAGTSCFLTPETVDFVRDLTAEAHRLGLEVLAEVHAHRRHATDMARRVDLVYDFVLAPLVLHAVFTGDCGPLRAWLLRRPAGCVTVLDTHDGIALVDAGPGAEPADTGLLSGAQLDALVSTVSANSGGTSRTGTVPGRVDGHYQISCTAYDAVGGDDRRYTLARLLQLFVPGIPQIYYVGLLAGHNVPLAAPDGDAREINRRAYPEADVTQALNRPVVRALTRLIRLRNAHPAFGGAFTLADAPPGELRMAWHAAGARADLWTRPADAAFRLTVTEGGDTRTITG